MTIYMWFHVKINWMLFSHTKNHLHSFNTRYSTIEKINQFPLDYISNGKILKIPKIISSVEMTTIVNKMYCAACVLVLFFLNAWEICANRSLMSCSTTALCYDNRKFPSTDAVANVNMILWQKFFRNVKMSG